MRISHAKDRLEHRPDYQGPRQMLMDYLMTSGLLVETVVNQSNLALKSY